MPRRGRSASPPPRRAAPATQRSAAPSRAPVPVAPPQTQMAHPAPSQGGPGIMGQMMATAGGVAIGSTVGHVVGHAITGGGSAAAESTHDAAAPMQNQSQPYQQQQEKPHGTCLWEMQQFINCAQTQGDISLCQGFNEALKQCREYNGISQSQ